MSDATDYSADLGAKTSATVRNSVSVVAPCDVCECHVAFAAEAAYLVACWVAWVMSSGWAGATGICVMTISWVHDDVPVVVFDSDSASAVRLWPAEPAEVGAMGGFDPSDAVCDHSVLS